VLSSLLITLLLVAGLVSTTRASDKLSPVEQKLREALRNTMIQLRDSNAKLSIAQAAQSDDEEKIADLQTQLDDLTKKTTAQKQADDQTIADQKSKLDSDDMQINHLSESLGKWKYGYAKLADYAKQTEGKRAELASKIIILDRRIADQQMKNEEMYQLANEVLDRYAKFGLGTAIAAREPFVGITKVKFQNLVQDYQNKLSDQTIRPDDTANAGIGNNPKQ
jgi:chromosome segregation ATPase